jgi:excisionase family DNA binding protein
LLTHAEVGRLIGQSRSSVYALTRCGRLPVVYLGRSARIPRAAVEALVAELLAEGRPQNESPGGQPGLSNKSAGLGRDDALQA